MDEKQLIEKVSKINVCKSGDKRSPHKPLLILLSLARFQQGKPRLVGYSDIEKQLVELLSNFGPVSAKNTPQLPFWHLTSDGFWEIPKPQGVLTASGSASKKFLRDNNVEAGFTKETFELLKQNKELTRSLAQEILSIHFPNTLHQDIIDEVGLDFEAGLAAETSNENRPKRDPGFRKRILEAYNYKCAICDFSIFLENSPVALEAAHIKWFQAKGPDVEMNGLALCSLHHKLLDRGAIAIDNNRNIIVSSKVHGSSGSEDWVYQFHEKPIRLPRNKDFWPNKEFTNWHIKEVFQSSYKPK
ncbi:phosphorothioated DNA-binding restriction endonuclease [Leucothrix pacifica]|uniref:Restriction endonuclease n=1 Tax=Leucothrix pacifica TaxID=1247513 RepID=A0A317CKK2_9GAMM|nr:restriction endonuclease [Leucothrix pacifica]